MITKSRVVGSPQQEAFWDAVKHGGQHVVLEARAGCGKSFSAREAMKRSGKRCTYTAYNKHVAEEFQRGLPYGCTAATMHSLGLRAVRSAFPNVRIDDTKLNRIIREYCSNLSFESRSGLKTLVSLAKGYLFDGSDKAETEKIVAKHGITFGYDCEKALEALWIVLEACKEDTTAIDFDDMVWAPVVLGLTPQPCDMLLIDEAQDLNKCRQALAMLVGREGQVIVIGDPCQAIYGFQGADIDSIPNMEGMLNATGLGCARLPLTVTRRCPSSVVELARGIVPDLEAMPDAIDGEIDVLTTDAARGAMIPGDMVLCRTNVPLVRMAFGLIREGTPATIRGRDFGTGLVKFVRDLKPDSTLDLIGKLATYREMEAARLRAFKASPDAITTLEDKCQCIMEIACSVDTVDQVTSKIEALFSDNGGGVILSSIHRSKGLEADRVFILHPELIPHPMAKSEWEYRQELNLAYVAVTRAKHSLYFVGGGIPEILGGY